MTFIILCSLRLLLAMVHASRDKLLGLFFELTHFRVPLAVLVAISECLLLCHRLLKCRKTQKLDRGDHCGRRLVGARKHAPLAHRQPLSRWRRIFLIRGNKGESHRDIYVLVVKFASYFWVHNVVVLVTMQV